MSDFEYDSDPYEDIVVENPPEFSVESLQDVSVFSGDLEYPCIILDGSTEIPQYKALVIKGMFSVRSEDSNVVVYKLKDNRFTFMGRISTHQVGSLVDLLHDEMEVRGLLSEDKELQGKYLYVLS